MKTTGFIRKIDKQGRISLPAVIRRQAEIDPSTPVGNIRQRSIYRTAKAGADLYPMPSAYSKTGKYNHLSRKDSLQKLHRGNQKAHELSLKSSK